MFELAWNSSTPELSIIIMHNYPLVDMRCLATPVVLYLVVHCFAKAAHSLAKLRAAKSLSIHSLVCGNKWTKTYTSVQYKGILMHSLCSTSCPPRTIVCTIFEYYVYKTVFLNNE